MRVLMTTDTLGGVFEYTRALARGLSAEGVAVDLAALGPPPSPARRREVEAIPGVRLHALDVRLVWMEGGCEDLARTGRWLAERAERLAPDVLHLNDWGAAAAAPPGPSLVVAHSCVTSWWRAVHGTPAPPRWRRYRRVVQRALARADRVVAPSRAMAGALVREHGLRDPARVIPNAREPGRYVPGPKQDFVLAAGRAWDAAKNVGALAEAARDLGWPVLLAGSRSASSRAAAGPEAREAAAPGPLQPLGVLAPEELAAWMGRAAVFAHPARYEPFGLVVLEAALCGCALVLGDIPSLREHWDGAARFVPPDDAVRLRTELRALRARPDFRRALGRAAARRAERFTLPAMTRAYRALYEELCEVAA